MNPYWNPYGYPPQDPYFSQPSGSDWSIILGWIMLAVIICAAIYTFLTNNSYDSTQTGNSTIAITTNSKKKDAAVHTDDQLKSMLVYNSQNITISTVYADLHPNINVSSFTLDSNTGITNSKYIYTNVCYRSGYIWSDGTCQLKLTGVGDLELTSTNTKWNLGLRIPNALLCVTRSGRLIIVDNFGNIQWSLDGNAICYTPSQSDYFELSAVSKMIKVMRNNGDTIYGDITHRIYGGIRYREFEWSHSSLQNYKLTLFDNCNLILRNTNQSWISRNETWSPVWSTQTFNNPNPSNSDHYLINDITNGRLLIYKGGKLEWSYDGDGKFYTPSSTDLFELDPISYLICIKTKPDSTSRYGHERNRIYGNINYFYYTWTLSHSTGTYTLQMQADNNLVLNHPSYQLNTSNTAWGEKDFWKCLQFHTDGNLYIRYHDTLVIEKTYNFQNYDDTKKNQTVGFILIYANLTVKLVPIDKDNQVLITPLGTVRLPFG